MYVAHRSVVQQLHCSHTAEAFWREFWKEKFLDPLQQHVVEPLTHFTNPSSADAVPHVVQNSPRYKLSEETEINSQKYQDLLRSNLLLRQENEIIKAQAIMDKTLINKLENVILKSQIKKRNGTRFSSAADVDLYFSNQPFQGDEIRRMMSLQNTNSHVKK